MASEYGYTGTSVDDIQELLKRYQEANQPQVQQPEVTAFAGAQMEAQANPTIEMVPPAVNQDSTTSMSADYMPELKGLYEQLKKPAISPEKQQMMKLQAILSQVFKPSAPKAFHGAYGDVAMGGGESPEQYDKSMEMLQKQMIAPEMMQHERLLEQYKTLRGLQDEQRNQESQRSLTQYRQAEIDKFKSQQALAEQEKGYKIALNKAGTPESIDKATQVSHQLKKWAAGAKALKVPNGVVDLVDSTADEVLSMSANNADAAQKWAESMLNFHLKDKGTDTQRMGVIVQTTKANETTRHNSVMEQIAEDKLNVGKLKLAHKERGVAGPWLKEAAERETMLETYNQVQKAINDVGGTGYLQAAGNWYEKAVNNQDPKLAKLLSDVELSVGKLRKERFGSSLTAGEKSAAQAFTPALYQNTEAFLGKLESLKELASKELSKTTENLLLNNAITYDGEITPENAYEVSRHIRKKLLTGGIGEQPSNRSIGNKDNVPSQTSPSTGRSVVKKQYNAAQNKTKIIYSDGKFDIVDGRQ